MIYWIIFIIIVFLLLYIGEVRSIGNKKKSFRIILTIICTLFAGLRDNLGADYDQYLDRLGMISSLADVSNWYYEPTFSILSFVVNTTILSEYFYFFLMSVITIIPTLYFFYRHKNPLYSIFIFITFAGLGYMQTFNVIRQYAAVAFICLAISEFIEKHYYKYSLFVLLASLFHQSALFMLIMPLFKIRIFSSKKILSLLLLFSIIIPSIFKHVFSNLVLFNDKYISYSEENIVKEGSLIFILLSIFMFYLIYKKDVLIKNREDSIIFILGFMCIFFYNLSVSNYAFARIALYMGPSLMILLTYPFSLKKQNQIYKILVISMFLVFFSTNLIINSNNKLLIPDTIKSFTDLIDK